MTEPMLREIGLALRGCTPVPIAAYLKALGIQRLVSEQADPSVRAMWKDEVFYLSSSLGEADLVSFFMDTYRPTPIIAPWNGGSGFLQKKSSTAILQAVSDSTNPRLADYRATISAARNVISEMGLSGRLDRQQKQDLMRRCRSSLPDAAVQWIDAAFLLSDDGSRYPALLGTGANDGNMEFAANFMQNLVQVLPVDPPVHDPERAGKRVKKRPAFDRDRSLRLLEAALFGRTDVPLMNTAVGQFNPGAIGGPNSIRGFEGGSLINPWDFVLTLEGSLVFAGSIVWRLNTSSRGMAAFPFTVDPSAAGWGSMAQSPSEARAETWVPLWDRPASYREVSRLFAEGRAQVGRRRAHNGTDFARAVAGLGVDRGIRDFVRYGFLRRSGKAFLSVPLGRMRVSEFPAVHLLGDLDSWLDSLRRVSSDARAPAVYGRAVRQIEDAMFAYCASGRGRDLLGVLVAVGCAERVLAMGGKVHDNARPLDGLRPEWALECGDSIEFRLALSLACIADDKIGRLRSNLEPVELDKGHWKWAPDSGTVVPACGDLVRWLSGILHRRLMDSSRAGIGYLAIDGTFRVSPLEVALFLSGQVDDDKIRDLLWALTAIKMDTPTLDSLSRKTRLGEAGLHTVPRVYALLKLVMLPPSAIKEMAGIAAPPEEGRNTRIPPEPAIVSRLEAGDPRSLDAAVEIAVRRLRASGFMPLASGRPGHMQAPKFMLPTDEKKRLLAALLFPVTDIRGLARLAICPSRDQNQTKGE
ncbi:MAG: type I-U CRISPR-associated protein Csx17 [Firmicutes bacterium]|nr:type I-U CRISPR-associated protein Csx17 [Bacillota bacterium]